MNGKLQEFTKKLQPLKGLEGPLLPILHLCQDIFGYVPIEAQEIIQEELKISNTKVSGAVSFYELFYDVPTGKHHIGICSGTSCHIQRSRDVEHQLVNLLGVKEGETTEDGLFTIVPVRCLGHCDTAPNLRVNETVYKNVTKNQVKEIIHNLK